MAIGMLAVVVLAVLVVAVLVGRDGGSPVETRSPEGGGGNRPADTGLAAATPDKAIRGHWRGADDELWISGDGLTFQIDGSLHTATYVITGTETNGGWGDFMVEVQADFGDDDFAWYEGRMSSDYPLTTFSVVLEERQIQFSMGEAYVGFDYVNAVEEP